MQVKSIVECSKGCILQYFWPSLSCHLSLRSLFCLFLSGRFTGKLEHLLPVQKVWSESSLLAILTGILRIPALITHILFEREKEKCSKYLIYIIPRSHLHAFDCQLVPIFGDGCWHPDTILTLTVFQSRQFFTLARPYIKYMLHSLQIFNHISCMVSILTIQLD